MTDWYKELSTPDKPKPAPDWYSDLVGKPKTAAPKDGEPPPFIPSDGRQKRDMTPRDYVAAVATPIVGGVAALAGLPQTILSAPGAIANYLGFGDGPRRIPGADPSRRAVAPNASPADGSAVPGLPTTRDVQDFAHGTLGVPRYEAESGPGKLFQAGIEGGTSGAPFGPPGMLLGAISGVTSEGAGQAAQAMGASRPVEIGARVLGGVGPGVGYGVYRGIRRTPGAIANEAMDGVTPQQTQQAQALMDAAQARGVPITAAEAIGQVTGGNPLQNVQRVVEQSAKGGPRMQAYMAPRPEQVRQAVTGQLDEIGQARVPSQVVADVSDAARERIQAARTARTQASSPYYKAAVNDPIDQLAKQPVLDMVTDTLRSVGPGGPSAKLLNEFAGRVKMAVNAAQLDDIYKTYRDKLAALPIDKDAVSTTQRGTLKPIVTKLGDVLKVESANIDTGRALHAANSPRVDYLRRPDMMGKIQKALDETADVAAAQTRQAGVVFNPNAARPQTIRAVAAELQNSSKPGVYSDLVRANMARQLDEAMRLVAGKPNQWAGSKFNAAVAGTPQQQTNLNAALGALPNGAQVAPRTQELMDVLGATAYRQPPGSMTEFNKQLTDQLSGGGLRGAMKPTTWLGETYDRFRYGANSRTLAEILTAPDGVDQLVMLARTLPDGARRQAVIQALLSVERGQLPPSAGGQ